jgi:dihydrofolate reductase
MPLPDRIEAYAIISADGMIADHNGEQPLGLRVPADQRFFHDSLAHVRAVAHGRFSHEGGPAAKARKRLVLTRGIAALAPHPKHALGLLWNPDGASLAEAWGALGLDGGVLGVIGGTDTFGLFLDIGYDAFHLTRAARVRLPGGRPVFPQVPAVTPEEVLTRHGMVPGPRQTLNGDPDVTLVTWVPKPPG